MKERGAPCDGVHISGRRSPAVTKEWKRFRDAAAAKKGRPVSQVCNIQLDVKERKLYRNSVVTNGNHNLFDTMAESPQNYGQEYEPSTQEFKMIVCNK